MDEEYISLKEAAQITGYSPDYIGQLIRSGKIIGKQVYTNVSWMTTAEAVLAYKKGSKEPIGKAGSLADFMNRQKRRIRLEFTMFRELINLFKSFLPLISVLIISFFIFLLLLFNYLSGSRTVRITPAPAEKVNNSISF